MSASHALAPPVAPAGRPEVRITGIELWPISSPFKHAFSMRTETLSSVDSVLIRISTDAGVTGVADTGNTSPWFQGETQGSIVALIAEVFGPLVLLGQDPRAVERIVGRMDLLARDNNQAKALVDIALHDIAGKLSGVPVYDLLGGRTVPSSRQGMALSAADPDTAAGLAATAVAEGYRTIKLKTGRGSSDDVRLVAAVREAVGPDVEIFIDVNGRWRYDEALHMIRRLEPLNLVLVEQPLPPEDVEGLVRLRRRVGTPIYADESGRDVADVWRLASRDAVDGLFFKISKAGGYVKARRWLAAARAAGLPVKSGCMIGCGIEAAAYTHLTVADEWLSRATHENIGPLLIHDVLNTVDTPILDDVALTVPRYEAAHAHPPEGPGLGVEVNEELLPRLLSRGTEPVRVV